MAHSTLGPSAAKRWMNCPGSVRLSENVPKSTSIYAAAGTVAHGLAEEYVTGKVGYLDMAARIGEIVKQDGHDIEITEEMIDGAAAYKDLIDADRKALEAKGKPIPVISKAEVKVHAKIVDERVWGTSDYLLYLKGDTLIVYDYKFGKGVVDAEENEQGALYVLAAMETEAGTAFDKIEFVIYQPRALHADGTIRRWVVSKDWLKTFTATAKAAAVETASPNARVVAGEWCRWCPIEARCPQRNKGVQEKACVAFSDPLPMTPLTMESRLPEVRLLDDAALAKAFAWEESVNSFFGAVKAVLHERLASGVSVPGVKLVEGRANRVWTNEEEVEAKFSPVLGEKVYEKKLLSPSKMEKALGKGMKSMVDGLTHKPEGKKTVALDSDPRPAARSSAQVAFGGINALSGPVVSQDAVNAAVDELLGMTKTEAVAGSGPNKDSVWPW